MERIVEDIHTVCKGIEGKWDLTDQDASLYIGRLRIHVGYNWGSLGPRGVMVDVEDWRERKVLWRADLTRDTGINRSLGAVNPGEYWRTEPKPRDNWVWLKETIIEAKEWAITESDQ